MRVFETNLFCFLRQINVITFGLRMTSGLSFSTPACSIIKFQKSETQKNAFCGSNSLFSLDLNLIKKNSFFQFFVEMMMPFQRLSLGRDPCIDEKCISFKLFAMLQLFRKTTLKI